MSSGAQCDLFLARAEWICIALSALNQVSESEAGYHCSLARFAKKLAVPIAHILRVPLAQGSHVRLQSMPPALATQILVPSEVAAGHTPHTVYVEQMSSEYLQGTGTLSIH